MAALWLMKTNIFGPVQQQQQLRRLYDELSYPRSPISSREKLMSIKDIKDNEWSLRAFTSMRAKHLFLRARAVIKFVLREASTLLENTDGEQWTLRKFSTLDRMAYNESNWRIALSIHKSSTRMLRITLLSGKVSSKLKYRQWRSIIDHRVVELLQ